MRKILLCVLLFFLFPGNIIIQAGAITVIIISFMQSIKKKLKDHLKNENKQNIDVNKKNTNVEMESKKQEINYLRELKNELTETPDKQKSKTYKKSKV